MRKRNGGNEANEFYQKRTGNALPVCRTNKGRNPCRLKEIVPVLERKDDLLSKVIVENTIRKLEKLAEPECSQFIADNRAAFIEKRDNSIRQRLAAAKARKGEPVLQGHDLAGIERFLPETRHMVTVDILNSDSPVGFPGERYRFFLSDEGYKNARASENRGEIKIRNHAAVMAGKLYPDKKPPAQER